jgi:TRAP-type transport system small permease protein
MGSLEVFKCKWDTFSERVNKFTSLICVVMILFMTAVVLAHVFFRYILDNPLTWGEEFARLIMVWAGLLGIGIALKGQDHVSIDMFTRKLSGKTLAWCNLSSRILIFTFLTLVFIWGVNVTIESYGTYLPAMGISWAWSLCAVPVSAAIQLIHLISSILENMGIVFKKT